MPGAGIKTHNKGVTMSEETIQAAQPSAEKVDGIIGVLRLRPLFPADTKGICRIMSAGVV